METLSSHLTSSGGMGLGRGNVFPVYCVGIVFKRGLLSMRPDKEFVTKEYRITNSTYFALQFVLDNLDALIDSGKYKDLTERHSYTRVYHGKTSK